MKFSVKDLFGKCNQICRKLQVWSHLLKKSLMENFLCSVYFELPLIPKVGFKKFPLNPLYLPHIIDIKVWRWSLSKED